MDIVLAKNAGFCFGVNRAVNEVYESLKKCKMQIYTFGSIIHNNEVITDLKNKGVKIIDTINELEELHDGIVVIRSHGVAPMVYDIIKKNNLLSIDMTCPYVKKIHKIVKEYCEKGYQIVIIGDSKHPEVNGINGWCNDSAIIINTLEECFNIPKYDKICIVAQTTFPREKWDEIKEFLTLNKCNEYVEFNTICNATSERQLEAIKIAKDVDAMLIIGGKNSSNSQKLFNICKENCSNCYFIEKLSDLNIDEIKNFVKVGITAGTSTPDWVILEVTDALNKLNISENNIHKTDTETIEEDVENMDDYSKELEESFKTVNNGDIVNVEVASINEDEIAVTMKYKSDGIIPKEEVIEDEFSTIKVGDNFDALVIRETYDGNLILSKKKVDAVHALDKAKKAFTNNAVILVKILKEVKGGLIGSFEGLDVFVPISQLSDKFVNAPAEFISSVIPAKIIKFEDEGKNIVVSSRVVLEENKQTQKENFWHSIYIGKEFLGKVKSISSYGVFIDIGGIDGLLHISEISYSKGDDPSKYYNIDDEVFVYIKEYDRQNQKIMLALKERPESPWSKLEGKYKVGDIIEGKVVKLMNYGAFVEIEPNVEGLVHISEISEKHLSKPSEVLTEGEIIKAKIINMDLISRKIGLSIKEVYPINSKNESNLDIDDTQKSYSENFTFTIFDALKKK